MVVARAGEIADEVGLGRLTLAAVADSLGVALPSLYKHVGGLADLRARLGAAALGDMHAALSKAAVGRSGRDALRAISHAYRDFARAHPGRYGATLHAPEAGDSAYTAAAADVLDVIYSVLGGYGLAGDAAVDGTRMLRATLHGFVTLENAGGFGLPRDVERSFDVAVDALDAAFRQSD